MGDIHDDDLEFRGGTLQLSTDHNLETADASRNAGSETSGRNKTLNNPNPSVLSGANSLSSSSASFNGKSRTI